MRWRRFGGSTALLAVGLVLAFPAAALASKAVVLVSGFNSASPFTVPLPACASQAGPAWRSPTGTAASLRAAGEQVFTAPVGHGQGSPTPCTAPGGAVPPANAVIDSNGAVDANGAALMRFLQFLSKDYGVTSVSLVGHSDGGLWSRSAITQMRTADAGPVVQSLTTLGTPHTGSFGADLAELVVDGHCEAGSPTDRTVCRALLTVVKRLIADLGSATIDQLSSSFLATWNPQQTIGCPIYAAAGTYVNLPDVGSSLSRYYNPNDGLVGQASALGEASVSLDGAAIPAPGPRMVSIGSYPVIHSSVLQFLAKKANTLTDDPAIGAAVVKAVAEGAASPACSAPVLGRSRPPRRPVVVRVRRPFTTFGGRPRVGGGATALLLRGASIRCNGRPLRSVPLLGSTTVRLVVVRCAGKLRERGRVLTLGRDPQRRTLVATRRGRLLSARIDGPALGRLRISARVHGSWRRLRHGSIRLPAGAGTIAIRAVGVGRGGERVLATAVIGA